jgi:hypothetical protein
MNKNTESLVGFYLVDGQPIKIGYGEGGGVTAIVFDRKTSSFIQNPKYVFEVAFGNGDIEQISEIEYENALKKRFPDFFKVND